MSYQEDRFTEIANAIREKDGTTEPIKATDFATRILAIESGGELPSTSGGALFTGATIPLTYKDNTHEKENNYEYKSAGYNITIVGLDGRATITGNGTKNVLVSFDVSSDISSLAEFTISLTDDTNTYTYTGLHAHYGNTVTGILTLAYTNIPRSGTGTIGAEYKFIETASTTLPLFSSGTALWNTIYSYQVLNTLIGNHSGIINGNFLADCYSFNQPLDLSNVTSIADRLLYNCYSFNQPLDLSNITSIGDGFLQSCSSFNQPLDLSNVTSIGHYFLQSCSSFNQPLDLSNVTSIGNRFLYFCYAFNQPLDLSKVTSIGSSFLHYCYGFNQPLDLSNITIIRTYFLANCLSFNQPLDLSKVTGIGDFFLNGCRSFNQPLDLSNVTSIGGYFLQSCYSFNQPLDLSKVTSIGASFLNGSNSFNQPLKIPISLNSVSSYNFMGDNYSLSTIIWNAEVFPTDGLSQSANSKTSTSGAGIKVYGTNREGLLSALPDRTSSPYRKLIDGGAD